MFARRAPCHHRPHTSGGRAAIGNLDLSGAKTGKEIKYCLQGLARWGGIPHLQREGRDRGAHEALGCEGLAPLPSYKFCLFLPGCCLKLTFRMTVVKVSILSPTVGRLAHLCLARSLDPACLQDKATV